MPTAIVTGAGGLVGSAAVEKLVPVGYRVIGIDNDMRAHFFGKEASTVGRLQELKSRFQGELEVRVADVRDRNQIEAVVRRARDLDLVVHTAAQPSHDWAAGDPHMDFAVNAIGTLNLLQAVRESKPDATFAHISTSKVYGDTPNRLPLLDEGSRLDLPRNHPFYDGITTEMSIDNSLHSLFGVSKASGDLLVQEFGRYFRMPTVCLRPGCVTGPAHAGVELHGFLAYLMKCTVIGRPYTVFGYEGKQVRCNIAADDLVDACLAFHAAPGAGAVYNIGGGRHSACSMLEAIGLCEEIAGKELAYTTGEAPRIGDHRWWVSDIAQFQSDYPEWRPKPTVRETLSEIYQANVERWEAEK